MVEPVAAPKPGLSLVWKVVVVVLFALTLTGLGLAWSSQQRLKTVEQALIKRQQDVDERTGEARTLARQAEAGARDAVARMALVEARLAEVALQRSQVDDMVRSLMASREENLLADLDAALRVAAQQTAITGSLEPLVTALTQADERLRRASQPRLNLVRLAVAKDLDRIRSASALDLPGLTVRLDEMVRVVDDLPLIAAIDRRGTKERRADRPKPADAQAGALTAPTSPGGSWTQWIGDAASQIGARVWTEVRDLVRVTRVDDPQAALLAPDQAFFLRENLKLRLLNARLALLSRQFDIGRADLAEAGTLMDRYFDKSSRRVQSAMEQLRQMAGQTVQATSPRADNALAALATAMAAR